LILNLNKEERDNFINALTKEVHRQFKELIKKEDISLSPFLRYISHWTGYSTFLNFNKPGTEIIEIYNDVDEDTHY
jgi:hypothetical protein